MRYSLIIASFALATLAAPVPQNQQLALEKRLLRKPNGQLTSGDVNLGAREFREENKREPEPMSQTPSDKREPEPEFREENKREPEPMSQTPSDKREPEAEPIQRYEATKREPEAEPQILRESTRSANDLELRGIYNSAVGIIEALKARGFSSDNLMDPK